MRGEVLCPEHGRLCAYGGDEPELCPWCHSTWARIVAAVARDPAHGHSCEVFTMWHYEQDRPARLAEAVRMRREAALRQSYATNTAGVE
jgi:predicted DsbA family dithiol-disulfide isomerase